MNKQQTPINTSFIPKAVKLAENLNHSDSSWLNNYRQAQITLLKDSTFPNKAVEHFKYNRLYAFDKQNFDKVEMIHASDIDIHSIYLSTGVTRLVFVDGKFNSDISNLNNHNVTTFDSVSEKQQQRILSILDTQDLSHNPFMLCNTSLSNNGIFLEINESSPKSIVEIISVITENSQDTHVANQIVMDIADRCSSKVVSRTISDKGNDSQALSTIRIISNVGDSANLTHYHLSFENRNSLHFSNICYNLHSNSKLNTFHAITGGTLKKVDIEVNHLGQHAYADVNGLYVASNDEQVDCHTEVNHPQPDGTTNENFRGLVNGKAEAVFNGRIHIFENAQKTRAEINNKNLILSDTALLHTKPELEIYADDVVCAHGATVSRLQDTALNYLRARGISKTEAELMLSYAFFDELLEMLDDQEVINYMRPTLFEYFK